MVLLLAQKLFCRFEMMWLDSRDNISIILIILPKVLKVELVKAIGRFCGIFFYFLRIGMVVPRFYKVGMLPKIKILLYIFGIYFWDILVNSLRRDSGFHLDRWQIY